MAAARGEGKVPRPDRRRTPRPDPARGEYLDERGQLRVCPACRPRSRSRRHVCGLADLQAAFRI
jgi:hypothetical protein